MQNEYNFEFINKVNWDIYYIIADFGKKLVYFYRNFSQTLHIILKTSNQQVFTKNDFLRIDENSQSFY